MYAEQTEYGSSWDKMETNLKKKTELIFLLAFACLIIPLASAVTLSSGVFFVSGLNSSITINFPVAFDLLNISNDSIVFYNLSYVHPSSCNGQSSFYNVYSYATSNQNTTLDQVLPSISCVVTANSSSSGSGSGVTNYPLLTTVNSSQSNEANFSLSTSVLQVLPIINESQLTTIELGNFSGSLTRVDIITNYTVSNVSVNISQVSIIYPNLEINIS